MIWDTIVAIVIILAIVIVMWARVSRQTVPEMLSQIKDLFMDTKDNTQEQVEGLVYYE